MPLSIRSKPSPYDTHPYLRGVLALASVACLCAMPAACQGGGGTSGGGGGVQGVGSPCTPQGELSAFFSGNSLQTVSVDAQSTECSPGVCLVNHFQGRVSCPLGQAAPMSCLPIHGGADCPAGKMCTGAMLAPSCMTTIDCSVIDPGLTCTSGICTCSVSATIDGVNYVCEPRDASPGAPLVLRAYLCHAPGECQAADGNDTGAGGQPKDCCVPGTDEPVGVAVCGQCAAASKRDAADAVYCSCRCCAPCCPPGATGMEGCSTDLATCGPACDPNVSYCSCPAGFACTGVLPGGGSGQTGGAYCVKQGTALFGTPTCGNTGHTDL